MTTISRPTHPNPLVERIFAKIEAGQSLIAIKRELIGDTTPSDQAVMLELLRMTMNATAPGTSLDHDQQQEFDKSADGYNQPSPTGLETYPMV